VHLEDLVAALDVGSVDGDLAVEAPGAQQRAVQDVRPTNKVPHIGPLFRST